MEEIGFKSGCLATGSVINRPSLPGIELALTSDDLLELTKIPATAVVLGGGPVALEMAHYLDALGTKITILQRNTQLLTGNDRDVADALADAGSVGRFGGWGADRGSQLALGPVPALCRRGVCLCGGRCAGRQCRADGLLSRALARLHGRTLLSRRS